MRSQRVRRAYYLVLRKRNADFFSSREDLRVEHLRMLPRAGLTGTIFATVHSLSRHGGIELEGFPFHLDRRVPKQGNRPFQAPFTHITPRTYGVRNDLDLQLLITWHSQIF